MLPFTVAFAVIWIGGVLLVGGAMFLLCVAGLLIAVWKNASIPPGLLMGIVIPPGMLGFFYILTRFGRWLANDEGEFLIQFLCRTLDARRV
jgi:hypothetical protein